jgi:hypothetical protein
VAHVIPLLIPWSTFYICLACPLLEHWDYSHERRSVLTASTVSRLQWSFVKTAMRGGCNPSVGNANGLSEGCNCKMFQVRNLQG